MKGKMIGFFATIVLPIALFLISPYWSAYFSDKKELSYEVLLQRQLANIESAEKSWPGIQISYQGIDVSTGSFLTLAITNTGKLPIKREDFDSPILIHIPAKDSIISFQSAFASPSNLDVTLTRSKEGLAAAPLLLNPGDRFVIEIFSRVPLEISDVTTRVVGLSKITQVKPEKRTGFDITIASPSDFGKPVTQPISTIPGWLVFLLTHLMLIGSLLSVTSAKQKQNWGARAVFLTFAVVHYLVAISSLKFTLLYFTDILEWNKSLSFVILMASTFVSALAAVFIRNRLLLKISAGGFKFPFKL
ncbi:MULTISPECIES: hypothetical protein [unclassified Pseudomonas]|uniref:hypothetical protein n=1 Tax=unclassified Pseudomonas TaxID=196821 RepID=UPI00111C03CB|nr:MULTISPECIES: hypothetical protein [unclassified Pseudomonas]